MIFICFCFPYNLSNNFCSVNFSNKSDFLLPDESPWKAHTNLFQLYDYAKTPIEWFPELFKFARNIDILPLSSVFSEAEIDFLESLNTECYKIASPEINNVTLIKGFFDDVVKTWDTKIDILHIDGFHSYEAVKNDFEKWSRFVNSTGVILFHDTDSHDARFGVKQFFQELDMPKHELFGYQGLGIVSNNKKLMKKIKEYTP